MTVYVDDMKARYGTMVMCHMLADSDEDLHAMADKIGVKRKHWQSPHKTSGSHYDICQSKRALAVKHHAVEITMRQMAAMNYRRKKTGQLGSPEDAEAWLREDFLVKLELIGNKEIDLSFVSDEFGSGYFQRSPVEFVLSVAGKVVAYCGGNLSTLKTICVHPEYRNKGYAKRLAHAFIEHVRQHGGHSLSSPAWVRSDGNVPAQRLLESLGFVKSSLVNEYWKQDSIDRAYRCPDCGNPCVCSAALFLKS